MTKQATVLDLRTQAGLLHFHFESLGCHTMVFRRMFQGITFQVVVPPQDGKQTTNDWTVEQVRAALHPSWLSADRLVIVVNTNFESKSGFIFSVYVGFQDGNDWTLIDEVEFISD